MPTRDGSGGLSVRGPALTAGPKLAWSNCNHLLFVRQVMGPPEVATRSRQDAPADAPPAPTTPSWKLAPAQVRIRCTAMISLCSRSDEHVHVLAPPCAKSIVRAAHGAFAMLRIPLKCHMMQLLMPVTAADFPCRVLLSSTLAAPLPSLF